jgi:mannose-6-phosphate isomerase-like protein (cupin superfamily)
MTIPPGSGIGEHQHTDEDEIYIVQQGKGTINDSGKEIEVNAGDAVLTGKGASHSVLNTGKADLVITAIIIQY